MARTAVIAGDATAASSKVNARAAAKNRAGPGPTVGPLIVPPDWAGRPDIAIDPFVEISPGVWLRK